MLTSTYRLPHDVRDRLAAALKPLRNRDACMALATFIGRFWTAPQRARPAVRARPAGARSRRSARPDRGPRERRDPGAGARRISRAMPASGRTTKPRRRACTASPSPSRSRSTIGGVRARQQAGCRRRVDGVHGVALGWSAPRHIRPCCGPPRPSRQHGLRTRPNGWREEAPEGRSIWVSTVPRIQSPSWRRPWTAGGRRSKRLLQLAKPGFNRAGS